MELCNTWVQIVHFILRQFLTVREFKLEGKNPIGTADLEWIFARNCEGTEQLHFEQKEQ